MDDIFRYIREHLTEDLSLETLEEQFYVSRYHLCREFKKMSGQTIHSYIVKMRLNLCKKHIGDGEKVGNLKDAITRAYEVVKNI